MFHHHHRNLFLGSGDGTESLEMESGGLLVARQTTQTKALLLRSLHTHRHFRPGQGSAATRFATANNPLKGPHYFRPTDHNKWQQSSSVASRRPPSTWPAQPHVRSIRTRTDHGLHPLTCFATGAPFPFLARQGTHHRTGTTASCGRQKTFCSTSAGLQWNVSTLIATKIKSWWNDSPSASVGKEGEGRKRELVNNE